jgi:hypothetical protein
MPWVVYNCSKFEPGPPELEPDTGLSNLAERVRDPERLSSPETTFSDAGNSNERLSGSSAELIDPESAVS